MTDGRSMSARITSLLFVASAAWLLAACSNDRFAWPGSSSSDAPVAAPAPTGPGARIAPPVNLGGRWTLSSSAGGSCAFTLTAAADATEGTIAPAGGCPLKFFTSRKWTYEDTGLVLRDHNGQSLGQLAQTAPNRFEGTATSGQTITMSR
jgi:hypothetical protein